jgi:hypothetical protein
MATDGRCPVCARRVPGAPGEGAVCPSCGVWVVLPAEDTVVAAPIIAVTTALETAAPAPISAQTQRASAGPIRPRHVLRWAAILVVAVLLLSGIGVQAYRSMPPSVRKVQSRLVGWDAAGDGSPYRVVGVEVGRDLASDNRFERLVDLNHARFVLRNHGDEFVQEGPRYHCEHRGDVAIGLDHRPRIPFDPLPVLVLNRTGRTYTGILGSAPFRLTLDSKDRFDELTYRNHRGAKIHLTYTYEALPTSPLLSSGYRNAANLPVPGTGESAGVVPIDWMMDARRPRDLSVRFVTASGVVMAETPWASIVLPDGFTFRWQDRTKDGVVDEGDAYSFQAPDGMHVQLYDSWADKMVGSPRLPCPWDPQWDVVAPSWRLYNLRQSS